jgi:ubiquinol-cytochrome c reductase cytochrome b/c1 subunit
MPSPYANEQAARFANGGAVPPDLSLVVKARSYERGFPQFIIDLFTQFQEQGPNYVAALLRGYEDTPPEGFSLPDGAYYNKYFPGHSIKMPMMLMDGVVSYGDGTPETADQYAKDVTSYLMWAAEPHMEARKRMGLQVMIFLLILSSLLYFTKKRIWADAH